MTRHLEMEHIVKDIQSFAARDFPEQEVWDYLSDTRVSPDSLSRYLSYCEERYTRHLIHKDADFELLVICWGSGHRAPIHGHEGELCWAPRRAWQAALLELSDRDRVPAPARARRRAHGRRGRVSGRAGGDPRRREPPGLRRGRRQPAPLLQTLQTQCDVYDSERGPKRRVSLVYDTIAGEPVAASEPG